MELTLNAHTGLAKPGSSVALVSGTYKYYHYGCDNTQDQGWGCGYRTLQTICSWIEHEKQQKECPPSVPSLMQIQEALVTMGDKRPPFKGSKEWIGSFEVCLCVDYFYQVPCKILHINHGSELNNYLNELFNHFKDKGSPVMMGGETDNSSKGIMGVCKEPPSLLIVDPHYSGPPLSNTDLQDRGWAHWKNIETFSSDSFYNLCLPQITSSSISP
ncbi:ufm1-specific protease 1 [Patella vulgata]|uniref:ufm1-specific protease 1 n=1 Tax=Patella vulgata TaxID=6465 RepID=UPI00217F4BED|nr:ufm1-specific protease 1 [Patella vulgata]